MYNLLILCEHSWLAWLLPFLLGLLIGWLLWGRFKSRMIALQGDVHRLSALKSDLEADLKDCRSRRSELEGDLALTKGRMREMEAAAASGVTTIGVSGDDKKLAEEIKYQKSKRLELEGQIAILRGTIAELEAEATKKGTQKLSAAALEAGGEEAAKAQMAISNLEKDLEDSRQKRSLMEGEIALLRGQISEMDAKAAKLGIADLSGATAVPKTTGKDKDKTSEAVSSSGISSAKFAGLKSDNLQVVEGIGPKMESILKENGVHTWKELGAQSNSDLKGILGKYGDRYRIIDPKSWNEQAALARDGKWDALISMQKNLDTGRSKAGGGPTDSKVEKMMVKLGLIKKWKENDLKAVEGIGPKIEKLLNAAGITTWRALSETSASRIQEILSAAGDRYRLADPGTWPRQAGMAADGKWDELDTYQDNLKGGK